MKRILKWTGIVLGSLIVLLLLGIGGVYVSATAPLRATYQFEPEALPIPEPDSVVLARGAHVAAVRSCTGCHGKDLAGEVMMEGALLGALVSANLTAGRGGIGQRYTTADWVRAIRHGVNPDGEALLIMPSAEFAKLGRDDLAALIAYLQQVPPVDNDLPKKRVGALMPVAAAVAKLPLTSAHVIDHTAPIPFDPEEAVTAEYGAYVSITCQGCHGDDYTGRNQLGTLSSNLTRLQHYSEADFIAAVREGVRPTGDSLLADMPRWTSLSDVEVKAVWAFLQTLEPAGAPVVSKTVGA